MTDMRKCIGSAKFGIEAHEAPATEFPAQPSQKDGLGRMCKPHWNAVHERAAQGGPGPQGGRGRDGRAGGRAAGAEAKPKRAKRAPKAVAPDGRRAGRRRIGRPRRQSTLGPRAPARGLLRSVASLATVGLIAARGPTWAPTGEPRRIPDQRPGQFAKPGRAHTVARARSAGKRVATWATPPRSVDAPFVELHERHSTAVLAMSNGAPPAASGTT